MVERAESSLEFPQPGQHGKQLERNSYDAVFHGLARLLPCLAGLIRRSAVGQPRHGLETKKKEMEEEEEGKVAS